MPSSRVLHRFVFLLALALPVASRAQAQPLTWSLASGSEGWPPAIREAITRAMTEAVAVYNATGFFEKHVTANYSPSVPTAQASYSGWIDFGKQYNTRTALHEIAHTMGPGTFRPLNGGPLAPDSAAGRLVKIYEGRAAVLSTGGSHFWPYGLNYDNEDGAEARVRHCKIVSAFRFDVGIVVDSDGDGLPDDWEQFHFANLDPTATGDADGDGISNQHELSSDSDPKVASPVVDGGTYRIRSQRGERLLTLAAEPVQGTKLMMQAATGLADQLWTARYVGEGFWRFSSGETDQVIEVAGDDVASGRPLQLARWSGLPQQQWRIASGSGAKPGFWQLSNRETGRVADALDGAEGAEVQQYPLLGNIEQQYWSFEVLQTEAPVGDAGAPAPDVNERPDAGVSTKPERDAGRRTAADAGSRASDGGTATLDATFAAEDDDAEPGAGEGREGCSLAPRSSTSKLPWLMWPLAALLVAHARRRR